jgi:hypothetical protein
LCPFGKSQLKGGKVSKKKKKPVLVDVDTDEEEGETSKYF